ncbi:hypothetical protein VPH35_032731 [Triticum aestivum]
MLPSTARPATAAAYTQPQLRQMRAQCIVFLAFKYVMLGSKHLNLCRNSVVSFFHLHMCVCVCARNQMEPRKRHLEIALGEDEIGGAGCQGETTTKSSPSQASPSPAAPLPLPLSPRCGCPLAAPLPSPRCGCPRR